MGKITFNDLLKRATSNKTIDSSRLFKPSDFYKLLNDPFWIWCKYHAPKEEGREEIDRHKDIRMDQGVEFEKAWVAKTYPQAVEVKAYYGIEAIKETLSLMMKGVDIIYQPHLSFLEKEIYGKGDILVRNNQESSDLGNYSYVVKEIKNSKKVKDYHKLQAGTYNYILGIIQGLTPSEISIVLKDGEEKMQYDDENIKELHRYLDIWKEIRENRQKPQPKGIDKTDSPWRIYSNKILTENQDLTLIPGIGSATRDLIMDKLKVYRVKDLEKYTENQLVNLLRPDFGKNVYNHALAYKIQKAVPINKIINKKEINKRVFYFDFETSDEVHPSEPPHVYLIGLWDKDRNGFKYFLGRGKQDEEKIFSEFLDYIENLDGVVLYHWASYEIGEIDKVIKQYPKLASRLTKLKSACVDLKETVKNNFYIPVPDYSIKKVAPFLGFSWRQKDVNAFESMVLYWDWLKNPDQKIIQKVLDYNEDDCVAMVYIDEKLLKCS